MTTPKIRVLLPAEAAETGSGPLYGYFHPETGVAHVLGVGREPSRPAFCAPVRKLGWLGPEPPEGPAPPPALRGLREEGRLRIKSGGLECAVEYYSLRLDVFSRNTGILESDRMASKGVLLVGAGSVGSLLALEFARAGVGRFLIVDQDVLAHHNLCRHQCSLTDVGRWKVEALRDRVLDVNPSAEVLAEPKPVQQLPREALDGFLREGSLIVGTGDNREADLYANRLSCLYRVPLVTIGLWERAYAGEVFYSIPGETPCYQCFLSGAEFAGARTQTNRRLYTTRENLAHVVFEPGISTDLSLVSLIGAKVAYDLLCRQDGRESAERVLKDLSQFTLVCNTTDPRLAGPEGGIFSHAFQVTRSLVVERAPECPHCRIVGMARA